MNSVTVSLNRVFKRHLQRTMSLSLAPVGILELASRHLPASSLAALDHKSPGVLKSRPKVNQDSREGSLFRSVLGFQVTS